MVIKRDSELDLMYSIWTHTLAFHQPSKSSFLGCFCARACFSPGPRRVMTQKELCLLGEDRLQIVYCSTYGLDNFLHVCNGGQILAAAVNANFWHKAKSGP
jgi:hypothetical protein